MSYLSLHLLQILEASLQIADTLCERFRFRLNLVSKVRRQTFPSPLLPRRTHVNKALILILDRRISLGKLALGLR